MINRIFFILFLGITTFLEASYYETISECTGGVIKINSDGEWITPQQFINENNTTESEEWDEEGFDENGDLVMCHIIQEYTVIHSDGGINQDTGLYEINYIETDSGSDSCNPGDDYTDSFEDTIGFQYQTVQNCVDVQNLVLECPDKNIYDEALLLCSNNGGNCVLNEQCIETPAPMVPIFPHSCHYKNNICNNDSAIVECINNCGGDSTKENKIDEVDRVANYSCAIGQNCTDDSYYCECKGVSLKKEFRYTMQSNKNVLNKAYLNKSIESLNITKKYSRLKAVSQQRKKIKEKIQDIELINKNALIDAKQKIIESVNNVPGSFSDINNLDWENTKIKIKEIKDQDKAILTGGSDDCLNIPTCMGGNEACELAINNWFKQCINSGKLTVYNEVNNTDEFNQLINDPQITKKVIDIDAPEEIIISNNGTFDNIENPLTNGQIEMTPFNEIYKLFGTMVLISSFMYILFYSFRDRKNRTGKERGL